MKNKKVPHNIIAKPSRSKKAFPWKIDFRKVIPITEKRMPFSNTTLEYIGKIMLLWVNSSDRIISLNKFLNYQRIYHSNLIDWTERCPKLKKAHNLTLQKISVNREELAFFKDGDQKTMAFMQGVYDPQWKAQEKYFNDLKAKVANAQAPDTVTVIMDGYKSDDKNTAPTTKEVEDDEQR